MASLPQTLKIDLKTITWFKALIIILLILGIFFRFVNLDRKVYWHDEAYTSMRAAGYTRHEIDEEIFQNRIIKASELQKFQQIKPKSSSEDTVESLATEDPQHPPFYFLIARLWMQQFGSSITVSRTLPAIISLISLPLIYFLALELFQSQLTALLSTVFLALSPFDLLFAQTARQYSMLTICVIASSFLVLKASRFSTWTNWIIYIIICTIGLCTHPFFALTLIAHAVFIIAYRLSLKRKRQRILLKYLVSIGSIILLYSPWILVLKNNSQRALLTTDWAQTRVDFLYLVKLWILSFTSLFIDFDFGFNNIGTYLLRLPFIILIFAALYLLCRENNRKNTLFILTSILVPFLLLVLPDLILGGKRSAVTRYLISCFPAIQLVVAYLFANKLLNGRSFWRFIFGLVLTSSIVSCTVNALADTSWSKDLSYFNAAVARKINAAQSPILVCDRGDNWTNMGDLLSLSYLLVDKVKVLPLSYPPDPGKIKTILEQNKIGENGNPSEIFIFRPSAKLRSALEQTQTKLDLVLPEGQLSLIQ